MSVLSIDFKFNSSGFLYFSYYNTCIIKWNYQKKIHGLDHEILNQKGITVFTRFNKHICLFVWFLFCLFVVSSHSTIVHLHEDVPITGDGLQILTLTWHSWPLSSDILLACHAYCDTDHPFIWSSPRTRDHNT